MNGRRVPVTGAAGGIGSSLVAELEGGLREPAEKVAARLPLGHCGHPEGGAAVVWLLGTSAGHVTGQALFVDGGMVRA